MVVVVQERAVVAVVVHHQLQLQHFASFSFHLASS